MSPNKRYIRWNDLISSSSNNGQFSYNAFDTKNGIEVVWHTINLNVMDESQQSKLVHCVNIVKNIQHKYIIEYQSIWFNDVQRTLNIVTAHLEPLKEFIGKVMTLRWRIVKKWSVQILSGLEYLHNHNIVHQNLTNSHIYINGGTSRTSVGDLWMAAILSTDESQPVPLSSAAPTAFSAPEQILSPGLDIYSFGMCILEMITREEPYSCECVGVQAHAKLRARVTAGLLPVSLSRVKHSLARAFLHRCLVRASDRASATALLLDPFLLPGPEDDDEVVVGEKLGNIIFLFYIYC